MKFMIEYILSSSCAAALECAAVRRLIMTECLLLWLLLIVERALTYVWLTNDAHNRMHSLIVMCSRPTMYCCETTDNERMYSITTIICCGQSPYVWLTNDTHNRMHSLIFICWTIPVCNRPIICCCETISSMLQQEPFRVKNKKHTHNRIHSFIVMCSRPIMCCCETISSTFQKEPLRVKKKILIIEYILSLSCAAAL